MAWFLGYFAMSDSSSSSQDEGRSSSPLLYACGLGYALMSAIYTATHHIYFFGVVHTGMRIRVALSALVYRKVKYAHAVGCSTIGPS